MRGTQCYKSTSWGLLSRSVNDSDYPGGLGILRQAGGRQGPLREVPRGRKEHGSFDFFFQLIFITHLKIMIKSIRRKSSAQNKRMPD